MQWLQSNSWHTFRRGPSKEQQRYMETALTAKGFKDFPCLLPWQICSEWTYLGKPIWGPCKEHHCCLKPKNNVGQWHIMLPKYHLEPSCPGKTIALNSYVFFHHLNIKQYPCLSVNEINNQQKSIYHRTNYRIAHIPQIRSSKNVFVCDNSTNRHVH